MVKVTVDIKDLHITQYGLRNRGQLDDMVDFVSDGGSFNKESLTTPGPLIQLAVFEDNRVYIADGHHRVASILMSGRDHLVPGEFKITVWKYSDYSDINLDCGWVTPFDPRKCLRIADYADFKAQVAATHPLEREQFIRQNSHLYLVKNSGLCSIPQMIKYFNLP